MDWMIALEQFTRAYQETGVSLKQWCLDNDVDYQSARKEISVKEVKASCEKLKKTKRENVNVCQPEKANHTSFVQGNQAARKHGAYASLLKTEDIEIAERVESLEDELLACRSRLVSVMKARTETETQWKKSSAHEEKIQCAEVMLKLVDAEERTMARIESLCSTLSKLNRDKSAVNKDRLQQKLIEQTIELRTKESEKEDKVSYDIDW
ncbi:hypothetical protein AB4343_14885 [Vibrio breoganii]|uniref:Uncharacterized protein n=1 Tax=Vibrio breoganii TaxID=553239 RepID=A0AAP8SVI7_9VIBR|nr:hypothetical protein [Vibrio breoganii]PMP05819.1 hypothetical protein BCS93_18245 [Vibrio breoganii]